MGFKQLMGEVNVPDSRMTKTCWETGDLFVICIPSHKMSFASSFGITFQWNVSAVLCQAVLWNICNQLGG